MEKDQGADQKYNLYLNLNLNKSYFNNHLERRERGKGL